MIPEDPITAYAVSHIPRSYTDGLRADALRGARIGILREPMDSSTDPRSEDYAKVATVVNQAIAELRTLGAVVIDSLVIDSLELVRRVDNNYETEQATNRYLAQHPNAPVKTFKDILLSGVVVPSRARALIGLVNLTPEDPGYLQVIERRETLRLAVLTAMANQHLDAIVYPTFWHQPSVIPDSVLFRSRPNDGYGKGDNRGLSPAIGFPALTVPGGFTVDGLPGGDRVPGAPIQRAVPARPWLRLRAGHPSSPAPEVPESLNRGGSCASVGRTGFEEARMPSVTLRVNGATRQVEADPNTPLLWVLRDVLNLTGTKYGCGIGQCGACTVHLDGDAVRSCMTPLEAVGAERGDHHRRPLARCEPPGSARLDRRERSPVRVLPVGPDHVRLGAARQTFRSHRCGYRCGDVREPVPLRHL